MTDKENINTTEQDERVQASQPSLHKLTTSGQVREELHLLWESREDVRDEVGKLQKKLDYVLTSMGEIDDINTDGIDIASHKHELEEYLKKYFDLTEEKDLSTEDGRERFSLVVKRANQKIILEEIENRMERANLALKEIDSDANIFGLKNYDPRNLELYNMLITLEGKLRKLIEHAFRNDKKWWKTRLPHDVRYRADEKFEREEKFKKEYSTRAFQKVEFLDFSDYVEIVKKRDNEEYFFSKKIFPSKSFLLTRLEELAPMRNIIVHRPPLEENDATRFRLFFKELTERIDLFLDDDSM